MTFLGLERPVEYGREQVFDPTTAQMVLNANRDYINAVYNDYRQALADMKEFNKEYGDFLSPIQADMDWYNNNVTGKIRGFINDLYSRGIDPLRSAEGRALVTRELAKMPVGEIAQMRQSAEAAREYIKNRGILQAAGKWDPEFEKFANQGNILENWDTSKNGVWSRTSPTELKTLKELTESWYNQRTAHMLDKAGVESFGMQYDPRYDYMGFTNKDLLDIASGQTPGWNGSIYADYYRNIARRQLQDMGVENPNSEQVEAMLQRNVATANKEYLINPSRSVNQLYLQELKNQQARAIAGLRGRTNNQQNEQDAPTTFMDRLQRNMSFNFENKYFGQQNVGKTFGNIIDYWNKMAKSVEGKGKIIKTEEVDGPTKRHTYFGGSSIGTLATSTVDVPTKETKNTYDQSNNALHKKYTYERDRWSNFSNGNYYPSKYDTTKTSDGKYLYQIINGIIKKGDKASPAEIQLLQEYQQNDIQRMVAEAHSSSPKWSGIGNQPRGTMSTADAKKRASAFWDTFRAEGLGPIQNKVLHQVFVGSGDLSKDPDLAENHSTVRFGSGYHYAPTRQLNISGNARFKYEDIHSRFDRFLQGETGTSTDPNDVTASGIPHPGRVGRQLDILEHPAISRQQLEQFRNSLQKSKKYRNMSIDDIAKTLGLKAVNKKLTYRGKDEELHSTDTYYEVPVIRTIENLGGYNFRDINALSDIIEFNAGTADKNIINSENQSIMDDLPIELATQLLLSE